MPSDLLGPMQNRPNQPDDPCQLCSNPVGEAGAKRSVQGFPYCITCLDNGMRGLDKRVKKK